MKEKQTAESSAADDVATDKADKPERSYHKLLRVFAYGLVLCTIGGALAVQSAYGGMKDNALAIGDELGKLGDIGTNTPLFLNGQPIHVGSTVLNMTVEETLDHAEELCERGSAARLRGPNLGGDGRSNSAVPDTDELLLDTGGKPAMGIVRQEREDRGVVLCFAPREGEAAPSGVGERMQRWMSFLTTGEVDSVGRLRYLYARKTDTGRTHLIRVWTDAPFNIYALTAPDGEDAPGTDPADMPRPPESKRLLSATVGTADYAVRVYESRVAPDKVAADYDRTMPSHGWKLSVRDGHTRVYTRGDMSVFVTPSLHEGKALVSMLHMGTEAASVATVP
jgi:hypothetical protein